MDRSWFKSEDGNWTSKNDDLVFLKSFGILKK